MQWSQPFSLSGMSMPMKLTKWRAASLFQWRNRLIYCALGNSKHCSEHKYCYAKISLATHWSYQRLKEDQWYHMNNTELIIICCVLFVVSWNAWNNLNYNQKWLMQYFFNAVICKFLGGFVLCPGLPHVFQTLNKIWQTNLKIPYLLCEYYWSEIFHFYNFINTSVLQ